MGYNAAPEEKFMSGDDDGPVRAFIAVRMPEEVRAGLHRAQEDLRRLGADVKWVALDQIHLTLAFLGNVPSAGIEGIKQAMDEVASGRKPIPFAVSGLGFFGSPTSPRVVWVGLQAPPDLRELQAALAAGLSGKGFRTEDREFHPHLTLGRTRSALGALALARRIGERKGLALGNGMVEALHLFQSVLRPEGPVYTPLHAAPIGGNRASPGVSHA